MRRRVGGDDVDVSDGEFLSVATPILEAKRELVVGNPNVKRCSGELAGLGGNLARELLAFGVNLYLVDPFAGVTDANGDRVIAVRKINDKGTVLADVNVTGQRIRRTPILRLDVDIFAIVVFVVTFATIIGIGGSIGRRNPAEPTLGGVVDVGDLNVAVRHR